MPPEEAKRIIEGIGSEILKSRESYIWLDYVRALRVISDVIFTRTSGFILELIQNAEDAGSGTGVSGNVEIWINKKRLKFVHNGRPFNEEDVRALCSIRSSKKPELGTLGYLGIGFKSVFKVTDSPEIYSGAFSFRFDRSSFPDPRNTPWQVIPNWVSSPSEKVNPQLTSFILPFRQEEDYGVVDVDVMRLKIGLYLFLRWLKRVTVHNEVTRTDWTLENVGDAEDEIRTLRRGGQQQRFKFYRETCSVPESVRGDRLVQEYRPNVLQREVVIAFAVDGSGNLDARQAGTMYGGVYSFLPLAEATSGASFAIQTDFLVQPGRETINYEARWNHWLIERVTELAKRAIHDFKSHPTWKYQFLPSFEFHKSEGDECFERFFSPKLIKPLEQFLSEDTCIPTMDGEWATPAQVVRLLAGC